MKIGFTGTRHGMTADQSVALRRVLRRLGAGGAEIHHGDCVGADEEAHALTTHIGFRTVIHPPIRDDLRAFCHGHEMRVPKLYMARNRAIVDETETLIACPRSPDRHRSPGTWATYTYARKIGRPVVLIFPDGQLVEHS